MRETARNSSHQGQVDAAVQVSLHIVFAAVGAEIIYDSILLNLRKPAFPLLVLSPFQALQEAIDAREESLLWLKSRLAGLSEVSSELEVQRQRAALAKLSTDLRALFSSLSQVFQDNPNDKLCLI